MASEALDPMDPRRPPPAPVSGSAPPADLLAAGPTPGPDLEPAPVLPTGSSNPPPQHTTMSSIDLSTYTPEEIEVAWILVKMARSSNPPVVQHPASSADAPTHTPDTPTAAPPATPVATTTDDSGPPQPQPQQPTQAQQLTQPVAAALRDSIQIPKFWKVKKALWPARALHLAALPVKRVVRMRANPFSEFRPDYCIPATIGQCVGTLAPQPCTRCLRGMGPFTGGCVLVPAGATGFGHSECCCNCQYQFQYKQCSFFQG
ncbi:hypothetical protein F5Y12DRAFT_799505 [Xylaria sp. FL1777]|nr:hypothetical protein F5Y12DRAFT_799505 [Xylaria sp. FL1777]